MEFFKWLKKEFDDMAKKNAFAKHAAPYLREALKKAGKTYHRGIKPRPVILKGLQKKRDELNARIKTEKKRGKSL